MGILDNIFGRKIEFNNKMNEFIESFKKIEWFKNCGNIYDRRSFCHYEMENEKNALKQLKHKTDYKEFVILENLFIEANRRLGRYLDNNSGKDSQWTWNKLAEVINKRFMNNIKEINFIEIDNNYSSKFSVGNKRMIYRIFRAVLTESFFYRVFT